MRDEGRHPRCFNSTLVRLKQTRIRRIFENGIPFQFHTGSIKAKVEAQGKVIEVIRFNSTLVRLKQMKILARALAAQVVSIPHWFD